MPASTCGKLMERLMARRLGRIQRGCLRVIEEYEAAGKRPTTFNIAAEVYQVRGSVRQSYGERRAALEPYPPVADVESDPNHNLERENKPVFYLTENGPDKAVTNL
jgi:hypothetical protein